MTGSADSWILGRTGGRRPTPTGATGFSGNNPPPSASDATASTVRDVDAARIRITDRLDGVSPTSAAGRPELVGRGSRHSQGQELPALSRTHR
jgi:hypothetical protein